MQRLSSRSSRSRCSAALRPLALAVCVAVAGFASVPAFAGQVNLSGLQSGEQYDQFIVKYRDGSVERRDVRRNCHIHTCTRGGGDGK